MATIPTPSESQTVQAIYALWAGRQSKPREYLGGSIIGRECDRQLWYTFRWANGGETFDGRMQRLFDRGQREEEVFVSELRGIGCAVYDIDPSTGKQFKFKDIYGHAGGSMDAVAIGIPEAPKTYHVCEFKTHNAKSFALLKKDGVQKAKPEHFAQMMIYMHWSDLTRAIYIAVNKDTDELYSERIRYDDVIATSLVEKATRIIFAKVPPPGISGDPSFYKCKFCSLSNICHTSKAPEVSCRTCLHATPEADGDGRWTCAKWGIDLPTDGQRQACQSHLYIPSLLARWGDATDASEDENWVEYTRANGFVFRNGYRGLNAFESVELAAMSPSDLDDPLIAEMRKSFDAKVIKSEAA